MNDNMARIVKALDLAISLGGFDGSHHKMYAIDQMVRALTGCPMVTKTAKDYKGVEYSYETQGESEEYQALIKAACDGKDGPNTYDWDTGCPP